MEQSITPFHRADAVRPRVQKWVDKNGLRQAARDFGVSVGAVSSLLAGSVPHPDNLKRFETVLRENEAGVALDWAVEMRMISERANGNPVYWSAQMEALAAVLRGRALDRMADAWKGAEDASKERAALMREHKGAPDAPLDAFEDVTKPPPKKRRRRGGEG